MDDVRWLILQVQLELLSTEIDDQLSSKGRQQANTGMTTHLPGLQNQQSMTEWLIGSKAGAMFTQVWLWNQSIGSRKSME